MRSDEPHTADRPRSDDEDRPSLLKQAARQSRAKHLEPGWYEWTLRQFLRYWFVLGVLALVLFVPLQILESLTPPGAALPPDMAVAGLAMLAAVAACLVACGYGYWYLWKADGWVDRAVARRESAGRVESPRT